MATYADPFLRLQVSGTHMGEEEWSWSLAFDGAGQPATVAQPVIDAVRTFHTTAGMLSQKALLTTIKLNEIGSNGLYTNNDTVAYDFPSPGVAGGAIATPPPQIAVAVTLNTGKRRGPGAYGRFYLPLPVIDMDTNTGLMAQPYAQLVADAAGTCITALQTALGATCVVASQGTSPLRKTPATTQVAPYHAPVTGVSVGRVYDTQRRRRSKLPEGHVPSATFTWSDPGGGFGGGGSFTVREAEYDALPLTGQLYEVDVDRLPAGMGAPPADALSVDGSTATYIVRSDGARYWVTHWDQSSTVAYLSVLNEVLEELALLIKDWLA